MAGSLDAMTRYNSGDWFGACDPPGSKLGSGGGTAHLLAEAWKATGSGRTFNEWLRESRKLIVHGGGQSRRLPAYAAVGKPFIPIPALRHSFGQSMEQTLIDVQMPDFRRILECASDDAAVMITSGDVLLRFGGQLRPFPEADVLAMGMTVEPEQAEHFGVFFACRDSGELARFLQKPSANIIRDLAARYAFLVDTGIWLLSKRAVMTLMRRSGWSEDKGSFDGGRARRYELYAEFGLSLGIEPAEHDPEIGGLTSAVISLSSPEFYHLGTSRQLIESATILQNRGPTAMWAGIRHPDQIVQNSAFEPPARREVNHTLWIENSFVPPSWKLECEHVLTGIPENDWEIKLERGVCLDFVPVEKNAYCVRAYGIDDSFSGAIGEARTIWLGRPALNWFTKRNIKLSDAGIDPESDIQSAPIFPLIEFKNLDSGFVEWLFAAEPAHKEDFAKLWLSLPKLSAEEIRATTNIPRLIDHQARLREIALSKLHAKQETSIFYRLDLEMTARLFAKGNIELPPNALPDSTGALARVHDHMFRAVVMRERGDDGWREEEENSFKTLREAIISEAQLSAALPVRRVLDDQIVWGRSPARLDLAGGWTDTPPYCIEHGGRVVNLAVNLNGQPPVQVFAKLCPRPELIVRSIDLGVEQRVRTYEDLDTYSRPGSEFALAKAAVALAGFLPRFHASGGYASLEEQFNAFGGGIELSLLAAMPAGSGLGTSSILAATLTGVLSELCGLGWDDHEIISRTLAIEQMLTTGGGWQDQAGAVFGGIKLVETSPGLSQRPTVRWLPDRLFSTGYANEVVLLYYTGLTRLAKNILQEIVRGMFLNSGERLGILDQMREHAQSTFEAIQRNDWEALCEAVRKSWEFNQRLDSGTNPPAVKELLDRVEKELSGAKLLGAGGGGYVLMLAKDREAGERIRRTLTENPPNPRARFVDMSVSQTGLEITRS